MGNKVYGVPIVYIALVIIGIVILAPSAVNGVVNGVGAVIGKIGDAFKPAGVTPGGGDGAPTHPAAQIQWSGVDAVTQASNTANDVQITKAVSGVFNFKTVSDQITSNSAPEQGAAFYAEGDKIIVHIEDDADPTGGEDYYDQWYYINGLRDGAAVKKLTTAQLSGAPGAYTLVDTGVDTGERVHWTSGTTNYWDIGRLAIVPRTDDASLDQYLRWKGTTMASMTDGTTEVTTQALQTADVTFLTDDEDLEIYIAIDTANLAYGVPLYTVEANGAFVERPTFIAVATNCTALSVDHMMAGGWMPINLPTLTTERAFYYKLPPMIPASGEVVSTVVKIPLEVSAATGATKYQIQYWMNDCQLESNVAVGAMTVAIPSNYGMVAGYGIAAIINDETLTVASGAGATNTLEGDFTTN